MTRKINRLELEMFVFFVFALCIPLLIGLIYGKFKSNNELICFYFVFVPFISIFLLLFFIYLVYTKIEVNKNDWKRQKKVHNSR